MKTSKLLLHGGTLLGIPGVAMGATYGGAARPDIKNLSTTREGKALHEINNEGDDGYVTVALDDGTYELGLSCPKHKPYENKCSEKGNWRVDTFKKIS